jgi:hypothetical protein
VGNIHRHGFGDVVGIFEQDLPADGRTPVVGEKAGVVVAERIEQSNRIGREFCQPIRIESLGLVAEVVAALVRDDDPVAVLDQCRNLMAPAVPELGKAVETDHRVARRRTGGHDVEVHAVGRYRPVVQVGQCLVHSRSVRAILKYPGATGLHSLACQQV